jgi:hypothetical protein
MAAHLSPRLSEIDLIDATSGHFPTYVQRAILSANVRTIQEALSLLNKLEAMEAGEGNRGSNQGQQSSGHKFNNGGIANQYQKRYDKNRQGGHHIRNFGYRTNQNFSKANQNGRYSPRYRESSGGRGYSNVEPRAASQGEASRAILNPQASSYNPGGLSTHLANQNDSRSSAEN